MNESRDKHFALLIDGDNISDKYIKTAIDELTNEGIITYKRIYGDFTSPNLSHWKTPLNEFSIVPVQQFSYTTGKNATDSAMIIDAMDILYSGKVDGFCIVSSDSDFTRLAVRLREEGLVVIGMGKQQTPRPFVTACSKFKYIDVISDGNETVQETSRTEQDAVKETKKQATVKSKPVILDEKSMKMKTEIEKIIEKNSEEDGYILTSTLGTMLQKKFPDFDSRNYGHNKLKKLLEAWGFEIKSVQDPNNVQNPSGLILYVK